MPSNGNVRPYRLSVMLARSRPCGPGRSGPARCSTRYVPPYARSSVDLSFKFGRGLVAVRSYDRGLTGGAEQRAILGPEMHEAVTEAVGDGMHAHVGEDPLRRDTMRDAQRVVEAVTARAPAERLPDAEGHE